MRSGAFWAGVLVGALAGSVVGVVCAPKPGQQVRGEVAGGVRKLRDAAADRGRRLWACCHRETEEARTEREVGFA